MKKGYFIPVYGRKSDAFVRYVGVEVEVDPENPKGKKTALAEIRKRIDKETEKIKESNLKHLPKEHTGTRGRAVDNFLLDLY